MVGLVRDVFLSGHLLVSMLGDGVSVTIPHTTHEPHATYDP
jgi:hypothetical protein